VILAGLSMAIAIALGYTLGGRVSNVARLGVRWPVVAVVGLALQMVPARGFLAGLVFPALIASFILLAAFVVVNLDYPGFVVILVGIALNLTVIAIDHGMPVTLGALASAHELGSLKELAAAGARYHLARPTDALLPLGDSIGSPVPFHLVVSPGDIAIYAGMIWFVVWAMGRHARSTREGFRTWRHARRAERSRLPI